MSEHIVSIDELIKELPPERQRELRAYAELLVSHNRERPRAKPSFRWAGALCDLRGRYNSVDLQHLISRWRVEGE